MAKMLVQSMLISIYEASWKKILIFHKLYRILLILPKLLYILGRLCLPKNVSVKTEVIWSENPSLSGDWLKTSEIFELTWLSPLGLTATSHASFFIQSNEKRNEFTSASGPFHLLLLVFSKMDSWSLPPAFLKVSIWEV